MTRLLVALVAASVAVIGAACLVIAFRVEAVPLLKNVTAAVGFVLVGCAAALAAGLEDA